jgi:hypothetical protein
MSWNGVGMQLVRSYGDGVRYESPLLQGASEAGDLLSSGRGACEASSANSHQTDVIGLIVQSGTQGLGDLILCGTLGPTIKHIKMEKLNENM